MSELIVFVVAAGTILVTPGPTNTLLAASAALVGVRRSLPLIVGELAGYGISISLLTIVGQPIFAAFPVLGTALRAVLCLYLLLLAWRLWNADALSGAGVVSIRRVFITTLLNPKAPIFAYLIFPTIRSAGEAAAYACTFAVATGLVATAWLVFGASVGRLARERRHLIVSRVASIPVAVFALLVAGPAVAGLLGR